MLAREKFDRDGRLVDETARARIRELLEGLERVVRAQRVLASSPSRTARGSRSSAHAVAPPSGRAVTAEPAPLPDATTLGGLVAERPRTAALLKRLGLDYCWGGSQISSRPAASAPSS